jgi:ABC-type bacteriocin/lantibiotic exporter with double-glycine peptidase domain
MTEKIRVFYPGSAFDDAEPGVSFRILEGRINCYLDIAGENGSAESIYIGTLLKNMCFRNYGDSEISGNIRLSIRIAAEFPTVTEMVPGGGECADRDLLGVFGSIYAGTNSFTGGELTEFIYRIIAQVRDDEDQIRLKSKLKNGAEIDGIFSRLGKFGGLETCERGTRGGRQTDDGGASLSAAVEYLLHYYGLTVPSDIIGRLSAVSSDYHEALSAFAFQSGIRTRRVELPADFHERTSMNPVLAFRRSGEFVKPVVLFMEFGSCRCFDPVNGDFTKITSKNAASVLSTAYQFYPSPCHGVSALTEMFGFIRAGLGRIKGMFVLFLIIALLFSVTAPSVFFFILDTSVPMGDSTEITYFTVILILLGLCSVCVSVFPEFVIHLFNMTMYEHLQSVLFDKLLRMPVSEFKKYESGDLVSRIMGIESLRASLFRCFMGLFKFILFSLTSLAVMFYIDSGMMQCTLAVTLLMLAVVWFIGFRRYSFISDRMELSGRIDGMLRQFFNGVDKIRMAGAEENVLRKYMKLFSDYVTVDYSLQLYHTGAAVIRKIYVPVTVGVFCIAAGGMFGIPRTLPVFISFLVSFMIFQSGVVSMMEMLWTLPFLRAEYNRIKPILEAETENQENSSPVEEIDGSIEASHVYFRYSSDESPVLEDIDFKIRPGEFVAFVGASGSGKSTLLKLLLGFLSPDSGVVYYGDRDLSGIELGSLRHQMGVILQTGRIFNGSILENVTFGTSGYSREDALRAMQQAELTDLIDELPMGIYTRVSTDNLSGGQQQRILIARALIGNPRLLIMDEATSALDNITQQRIQDNLEKLKMTRIVVAHRLSTVVHADRIFVMDHGRIVQCGTYSELNSQPGIFRNLAAKQTLRGSQNV